MAIPMKNRPPHPDTEDPADIASEPGGEPPEEGAGEGAADMASEPAGEPLNDEIADAKGDGEPNVTPEEQAAYDTVMTAVLQQLYGDDASHNAIVQKLGTDPGKLAFNIGHTAAMILTSLSGGAKQKGKEIPEDVLLSAGEETVAELIDVAIAAKLADESGRDELYKKSMLEGVKAFGEAQIAMGQLTPERMTAAANDFREIQGGVHSPVAAPPAQGPVAAAKQMQPGA